MDYQALRTELESNQAYAPRIAAGDDAGIAAMLNAKTVDALRSLTSRELLVWAAQGGRYIKLESAAADTSRSAELRSVCKSAVKILDRDGTGLDLRDAQVAGLLGALVASGVLTAADQAAIRSMAANKISRAEELFGEGVTVTSSDISLALRGQR